MAEARRRVAEQAVSRSGSRTARTGFAAAVLVAVPGTILLSVLWAWLAITTSDLIWWAPTVGGLATAGVLAASVWLANPPQAAVTGESRAGTP